MENDAERMTACNLKDVQYVAQRCSDSVFLRPPVSPVEIYHLQINSQSAEECSCE